MRRILFLLPAVCLLSSCATIFKSSGHEEKFPKTNKIAKYSDDGVVNLHVSMPWINMFSADYGMPGRRSNVGFMGASVGLDYFWADNSFVNISAAGIMDAFILFPAPVDYEGMHDHMFSVYGYVSNNHLLARKRFSFGYGVSFGRDTWNTLNHGRWPDDATEEEMSRESIHRVSNSLGLVVPLYYYTRRSLYMGLVYRPMIVQFADKARFRYGHTASFEIGWRIKLAKIRP